MKISILVSFALLATLLSHNIAGANQLLNGSFESPIVTPGTFLDIAPGAEPAGFEWKVGTGNIDLAGPNPFILFPAYDLVQSVDLNGFVHGSLYQDFPTIDNQEYSLTFAYADNPQEGGVSSAAVVVIDVFSSGTLLSDGVSHSTSTNGPPADGDWFVYSSTFTATGATTRLFFTSTSASNSASGGIILDDVIVQPVPEPSSLILAALGLIGFAAWGWRRKR